MRSTQRVHWEMEEELTGVSVAGGANTDTGRLAADECCDKIAADLEENTCSMLFITIGMGGGTGAGAAPVVVEIAFRVGVLTVAVVTFVPFLTIEGTLYRATICSRRNSTLTTRCGRYIDCHSESKPVCFRSTGHVLCQCLLHGG